MHPLEPVSHFKNLSKVEYHLFDSKLVDDKFENIKFSTGDKQRLIKRRERVKSIKFLRKMGNMLRIEQNRQVQAIMKFDKQKLQDETVNKLKRSSTNVQSITSNTFKDLKKL